jgi:hypothetical protein
VFGLGTGPRRMVHGLHERPSQIGVSILAVVLALALAVGRVRNATQAPADRKSV